jgi:cysteine desulfurase
VSGSEPTYLDHATTTPLHPVARAALLAAYDEGWADPTRLYAGGRRARLLLDDARASVGRALGARPDEVHFTTSGTASIRAGLLGSLAARRRVGRHLITTAVEHSAVLRVADEHDADGGETTRIAVDELGHVDVAALTAAFRDDTALVSVQHANHEVGTRQPLEPIAAACAERAVPLHVDAAQSVGRVHVDVAELGVSLLSASAHKWGGPPGVGVLVVRKGTRFRPVGEVEPSFPDVPAITAAASALDATLATMETEAARQSALVDRIRAAVASIADVQVVGDPVQRLPHLVTFSALYVDGEALVTALDRAGFAVNSGSACTSSTLEPSHVLAAMGVLTHGNVRVSVGAGTTADDVERFLAVLPEIVARLRSSAPAAS